MWLIDLIHSIIVTDAAAWFIHIKFAEHYLVIIGNFAIGVIGNIAANHADSMVRRGLGSDDRIGKRFLFPGIGYGGSCFPKDVQALVQSAAEVDYSFNILKAVMDVNERQKTYLLPRIKEYFNNDLKNKKITLWGLAFKPNTDDIREAPALAIIDELLREGASISAFDPEAMPNVKKKLGDRITFMS